jgi:hypothetical protein
MARRGRRMWAGRQADSRVASHRLAVALFCALALFFIAGSLLWSLPVKAAATPTTFYGVSDSRVLANSLVDTPTSTNTPAPTPTDTPAPTATDTPAPAATNTPAPTATPSNPYALNVTGAASGAGWPQHYSNWCGIATVALVANYLGNSVSQPAIYNMLNSQQNESMWGYPPPSSSYWGPYLAANISGDFGTDPRSLAEGMTLATGRLYHVKVGLGGAWDTTIHIVDDLLISRQPISVFVDHGMHSVIVSGVEATGDPLANPNNITAIHVWDPGGGVNSVGIQADMPMVVKMSDWLSGTIPWSGASYFKSPYAANVYQGKALDPDPAVGPYAYVPSQVNHLWVGHYVYISPLASGDASGLSPDWELNQNGVLIAGLPGGTWPNLPDGYTGSSIPMPTNPPPPPPPVKPPVIAPKKAALPPPRPTPTPRATATSTALPTATSLPTAAPTATARPAACAPLNCALSAMQSDAGLLVISLLLLLLTAVWFPAAILVARARAARMQWSKEKMLQALATSDLAASDAPTLAVDTAPSGSLTEPLEAVAADDGDTSPDAPADVANAMPTGATHSVSEMSDDTSTAEAPNDTGGAPLD